MKKSTRPLIFGAILIAIYSFIFTAYMERIYPVVGHDFSYFMPRLIDTYLHYSINGLAIQWYTPSFGGGVPVYANPQSMQFSLVQAFTSIFNPWLATELQPLFIYWLDSWRAISSLKIYCPGLDHKLAGIIIVRGKWILYSAHQRGTYQFFGFYPFACDPLLSVSKNANLRFRRNTNINRACSRILQCWYVCFGDFCFQPGVNISTSVCFSKSVIYLEIVRSTSPYRCFLGYWIGSFKIVGNACLY